NPRSVTTTSRQRYGHADRTPDMTNVPSPAEVVARPWAGMRIVAPATGRWFDAATTVPVTEATAAGPACARAVAGATAAIASATTATDRTAGPRERRLPDRWTRPRAGFVMIRSSPPVLDWRIVREAPIDPCRKALERWEVRYDSHTSHRKVKPTRRIRGERSACGRSPIGCTAGPPSSR